MENEDSAESKKQYLMLTRAHLDLEYNLKEIWEVISEFANSESNIGFQNLHGIYMLEQIDCTVYTFALFSHAIQVFGVCIMSVRVFLYFSLSLCILCSSY